MKRLLFAAIASIFIGASAMAQCPGCAIDMTCTGTTPTLCPASLPDAYQGQSYDQDLTFFLPQTFTDAGSGTQVTLQQIVVTGLSGIPSGLSWQTNSPNNTYVVTSDPNTQRGCAKVCGTPSLPGSYNVTVSVIATVNTIIGVQSVPQSFVLPLIVHPAAGGNPYFTFNPSSSCGNASVTYQGLINLGLPQVTEYEWDFGNGNTSTVQNPPVQQYTTPGEYHPTLSTNIYDLALTNVTANITGGWWQGIWPCNGTSVWFNFSDGVGIYSSGTTSSLNPSWAVNPPFVLAATLLTIDFKQKQGICPTWDGGSYTVQINGPGIYNFTTTAVSNGGGGANGTFTIGKQLFESYVVTDTLHVYNLPPLPTIQSSVGSFTSCAADSIKLFVYGGPYIYEWYQNDTTLLVGENDSILSVPMVGAFPQSNNYKVKIMDTLTGCAVISQNVPVTINESVPAQFTTAGAYYANGILRTNYTYPTYQWLLNGTPLVPAGVNQTLIPTLNGNYSLVVTTDAGCSDTSNIVPVFNVSIDESALFDQYVTVYPNPSNGEFTLNMDTEMNGKVNITLLDLSGKTVYAESIGQLSGSFNKTFDLTHLSAGIYTLNLAFDQGTVRRKIIIR